MAVEEQPDQLGKIALCVTSCMLAKEVLVEQEGIGEDVSFTLFGWKDSALIIVGQLDKSLMTNEADDRLQRIYFCASMFRMGWGCDALTFVAEAYCSDDPDESYGKPLDSLFAGGNQSVSECLTFTHVEDSEVSLILVPYKVGFGRKVEWKAPINQKEAKGLRNSAYPQLLLECLEFGVRDTPPNLEPYYDHLITGLTTKGFNVDFFGDI